MQIETPRLILREYRLTDVPIVNGYSSNPKVVKFVPFGPTTTKDVKKFIQRTIKDRRKRPRKEYQLAVTLKETKQLIGGCNITVQSFEHKKAHIGYMLDPAFHGNGYATEAANALLKFGFKTLKLHRIYGSTDIRNHASVHVMEKCGLKREAHLRHNVFQKGEWRDSYIYAILIGDYKSK